MIVNDPDRLAERRARLSDLSWWMRCTAENIARRSNAEDQVTGHFWEGRYKAVLLLDEASLSACSAYMDLNPIRAAIAAHRFRLSQYHHPSWQTSPPIVR